MSYAQGAAFAYLPTSVYPYSESNNKDEAMTECDYRDVLLTFLECLETAGLGFLIVVSGYRKVAYFCW